MQLYLFPTWGIRTFGLDKLHRQEYKTLPIMSTFYPKNETLLRSGEMTGRSVEGDATS